MSRPMPTPFGTSQRSNGRLPAMSLTRAQSVKIVKANVRLSKERLKPRRHNADRKGMTKFNQHAIAAQFDTPEKLDKALDALLDQHTSDKEIRQWHTSPSNPT